MLQATTRETLLSYSFRLEAVKVELEGERQTLLVWHRRVLSMIVDAKPLASLALSLDGFINPVTKIHKTSGSHHPLLNRFKPGRSARPLLASGC